MEEIKHETVTIRCQDGCSFVGLDHWLDEPNLKHGEFYGEFYISAFAAGQQHRLKERLKIIWMAIRGKEYVLQSIVLTDETASQLRDFLTRTTYVQPEEDPEELIVGDGRHSEKREGHTGEGEIW